MSFETMSSAGIFRCPVCRSPLVLQARSLICEKHHTFDLAKSGYVNLLCANTKNHGDDKNMIAARRAFLEKGYYEPLRQALASTVSRLLPNGGTILDSGCGEGYYTEALAQIPQNRVYGIDIAARAAAYSAKRPRVCGVAVASAYNLPVQDEACDLVSNVFAPFCRAEFSRVLKRGGYLINVIPAERHLWELKCILYDKPYENEPHESALEGFEPIDTLPVSCRLTLPCQEDIASLLLMTPYCYRTDREGLMRARALSTIELGAAFYLLVYRKL